MNLNLPTFNSKFLIPIFPAFILYYILRWSCPLYKNMCGVCICTREYLILIVYWVLVYSQSKRIQIHLKNHNHRVKKYYYSGNMSKRINIKGCLHNKFIAGCIVKIVNRHIWLNDNFSTRNKKEIYKIYFELQFTSWSCIISLNMQCSCFQVIIIC